MTGEIALIVENPLTTRDCDRYGVNSFLARGFSVSVFDITKITYPDYPETAVDQRSTIELISLETSRDIRDMTRRLKKCDLAILLFGSAGVNMRNLPVFRGIAQSGVRTMALRAEVSPSVLVPKSRFERLADYARRWRRGQVKPLDSILARLPIRFLGLSPLDFIVNGGKKTAASRYTTQGPQTRRILAHAVDYDRAKFAPIERPPTENFAVFLDQYWPFHPDFIVNRIPVHETSASYHSALLRYFEAIRKQTGIEVVVAAHPRAERKLLDDAFAGCQVWHGITPSLIAHSQFVIAHYSTAINLAVLHDKPVMLVATNAMLENDRMIGPLQGYSNAIKEPVISLDEGPVTAGIDKFLAKDRTEIYRSYVDDYVKRSDTPVASFWDIVLAEVFPAVQK